MDRDREVELAGLLMSVDVAAAIHVGQAQRHSEVAEIVVNRQRTSLTAKLREARRRLMQSVRAGLAP